MTPRSTPAAGMPGVSIVVPVYNSAGTLPDLVARIDRVFDTRDGPFEVILVDDGSTDASWAVIEDLARRVDAVTGVRLASNVGQHPALLCGIRHARHAVVVTMDDDLQHPPEEIPVLLAALEDHADVDVVYGQPIRHRQRAWRVAASWVLSVLVGMNRRAAPRLSAFRAFRTRLRDAFAEQPARYVSIDAELNRATNRYATVRFAHQYRQAGRSSYTLAKLARLGLATIRGFRRQRHGDDGVVEGPAYVVAQTVVAAEGRPARPATPPGA